MGRERRSEGTLTVEVELEPVGEDVCCGDVELQGHVFHNALKAPRHQEHLDPSLVQPAHQLPERRQHKAQINPSQTKLGAIPVQFWRVLLPAPSTSAAQNFSSFLCAHTWLESAGQNHHFIPQKQALPQTLSFPLSH